MLRIIAGTEEINGERALGHNVNFSFYAQHQLESLHINESLLEELKYADPTKSETELRSVLGCFLFGGEDVFKKIKVLSGGEKSRVALAKVLISEANFLLLDEPTNHLDMQSVNILVQALNQYEGTYVVVSHDRHFVSRVANKIWYIDEQEIKTYPGTFEEYLWWMEKREKEGLTAQKVESKKVETKVAEKPKPSQKDQNLLKKLERELAEVEDLISKMETEKVDIEHKMADEAVFSDETKLQELNRAYEKIKAELAKANEIWEEKMMALEE